MAALSRTIDRRLRTAVPADAVEEELAITWKASYEVITGLLELSDELGRKLPAEDAPVVICTQIRIWAMCWSGRRTRSG